MSSPNPLSISLPTQKVIWKVVATNNGGVVAMHNVRVTLTWSDPINYHRISSNTDMVPGNTFGDGSAAGTFFDTATHIWHVGTLQVGQSKILYVETNFNGNVVLGDVLPFTLTKVISLTGYSDPIPGNNTSIDTLNAPMVEIPCAPAAGTNSGINCRCSLVPLITPCNYGITRFEIVPGSYVNTTAEGVDFDTATGEYNIYHINPSLPASFQYRVYCDVGEDTFGPFGPSTLTMPALFSLEGYLEDIELVIGTGLNEGFLLLMNGVNIISSLEICEILGNCDAIIEGDLGL